MQIVPVKNADEKEQPPWTERSYRLLSLLEMLEFAASDWNEIIRSLEKLSELLSFGPNGVEAVVSGRRDYFIGPLRSIADHCIVLGLFLSASYADELIRKITETPSLNETPLALETINAESLKPGDLVLNFSILKKRIDDELLNRKFFAIPPERARFYRNQYALGREVWDNFPSARYDGEEAGTCYACGRATACVFHLMRVTEVGLRTLGSSLGNAELLPQRNPSWERILKPCDDELKKPLADRNIEWRANDLFFCNATANLRAVKDAWRNPTLHVEIDYDDERALEILNAVRAFMRHLATKLRETK